MEFMKGLHDKYYDLAIVDPPYGQKWGNIHQLSSGNRVKLEIINTKAKQWDIKPNKVFFDEIKRISKVQIIFGYNHFTEFLKNTNNLIIWDKEITGLKYFLRFEVIYISIQSSNIIKIKSSKNIKTHACQKPVALYKWLLKNYAKPGQKIFDSHVGSGSIRIACHDMGFDFEGCEIDKEYFEAQEERFNNHIAQIELFDTVEIQKNIYNGGQYETSR